MRHEAGLQKFTVKVLINSTLPENILKNKIGKIIELENSEI